MKKHSPFQKTAQIFM